MHELSSGERVKLPNHSDIGTVLRREVDSTGWVMYLVVWSDGSQGTFNRGDLIVVERNKPLPRFTENTQIVVERPSNKLHGALGVVLSCDGNGICCVEFGSESLIGKRRTMKAEWLRPAMTEDFAKHMLTKMEDNDMIGGW